MKFLTEKYDDSFDTVAHVFGNEELQNKDKFIKECYEQHSGVYKITVLPKDKIKDMITHIKDNINPPSDLEVANQQQLLLNKQDLINRFKIKNEQLIKQRTVLESASEKV